MLKTGFEKLIHYCCGQHTEIVYPTCGVLVFNVELVHIHYSSCCPTDIQFLGDPGFLRMYYLHVLVFDVCSSSDIGTGSAKSGI